MDVGEDVETCTAHQNDSSLDVYNMYPGGSCVRLLSPLESRFPLVSTIIIKLIRIEIIIIIIKFIRIEIIIIIIKFIRIEIIIIKFIRIEIIIIRVSVLEMRIRSRVRSLISA